MPRTRPRPRRLPLREIVDELRTVPPDELPAFRARLGQELRSYERRRGSPSPFAPLVIAALDGMGAPRREDPDDH